MAHAKASNKQVRVLYVSIGTEENVQGARTFHQKPDQNGINTCTSNQPGHSATGEVKHFFH